MGSMLSRAELDEEEEAGAAPEVPKCMLPARDRGLGTPIPRLGWNIRLTCLAVPGSS